MHSVDPDCIDGVSEGKFPDTCAVACHSQCADSRYTDELSIQFFVCFVENYGSVIGEDLCFGEVVGLGDLASRDGSGGGNGVGFGGVGVGNGGLSNGLDSASFD